MIADWYRIIIHCDCVMFNSGNFRADTIVKKGPITYGVATHLIEDVIVTKRVKGNIIHEAL